MASRITISKEEERELLLELSQSLAALRTPEEMMQLIVDLLSKIEVRMLARRLKIARLLIAGKTYVDIRKALNVSFNTVARVAAWLALSGAGYRMVVERTRAAETAEKRKVPNIESRLWKDIRRKYPSYYWPQLLLEEIVRSARKRDRERLGAAVNKLSTKSALYKQLDAALRQWGRGWSHRSRRAKGAW